MGTQLSNQEHGRQVLLYFLGKARRFLSRNSAKILGVISPIWFLLCILGLNYIATDHLFAYLYGDDTYTTKVMKVIAWFMSAQMLVNWFLMSFTTSTYINTEENNAKRLEHERLYPQFPSTGVEYSQLKEKRPQFKTANWAVITDYTSGEAVRTAYPYWSWKPCVICSCDKPPRCHHCEICKVCVLKRDHHCFFARNCIGLENQRFFVVFNFWAVLLVLFAIPQVCCYTYLTVWPSMMYIEMFLPLTALLYLGGITPFYILTLVFQIWSLFLFLLLAGSFLWEQYFCIDDGKTSYERENPDQEVCSTHVTRTQRFAAVFGKRLIWLNLFIPLHWMFRPTDDGVIWSSVKME